MTKNVLKRVVSCGLKFGLLTMNKREGFQIIFDTNLNKRYDF